MTEIIQIPGFSEPFSSLTHLLAAGLAFIGLFYLYRKGRGNGVRLAALLIFSFSLIFLFSMSGVYHLLDPAFLPRRVLQRLDHAAIWVLIAGTFTPIHIILFRGAWRWAVLCVVWTIAITGLVLEVIYFNDIPTWLSLSLYLGLGWVGLLTSWRFYHEYRDPSNKFLWLGGVYYSVGAVIEAAQWPTLIPGIMGPHEIFHVFVVLGATSHWLFVYRWAHYPTNNKITFNVRVLPDNQYIANAVGERFRMEAQSIEVLKQTIGDSLSQVFHHKIQDNAIRLKFHREEYL
ncbi:MAG: hemolysin III family protein [Thiohalomonadales bacterium]